MELKTYKSKYKLNNLNLVLISCLLERVIRNDKKLIKEAFSKDFKKIYTEEIKQIKKEIKMINDIIYSLDYIYEEV